MVFGRSPWLLAGGAAAAALTAGALAAGGGYALRAATAEVFDPFAAAAQPSAPGGGGGGGEPAGAPLGNDAGLTYTRLDGAAYLRVEEGRPVARITPTAAEAAGGGVALTFTGEYLAEEGELALEPGQFFHFAAGGAPATGDAVEQGTVVGTGESPLATLSPGAPEQEFTVVLPGAPEAGAVSYFAEAAEQADPYYRVPICYRVGGDFSAEREDCEEVPEAFAPGF
ncbi:hypothetical protein [Streptomonospora mangrovi]|nr:hypothetical protein [Streptomonospora mangrovi]